MSSVTSYKADSASAPGCTIVDVKTLTVEDTVQQLEIYADGEDIPTIFPYGRKMVITIEATNVAGASGKTGTVTAVGTARARSLPAAGSGGAFDFTGTGIVASVRNSAPQVDGGSSSGTVVVVVPMSLPA